MERQSPKSLKQIFSLALDIEPEKLSVFLARACGGNSTLEAEVRSLLETHTRTIHFLDPEFRPPRDESTSASATQQLDRFHWLLVDEQPGTQIDRYKLIEVIGEGGHGIVFRAEQEQPVRRTVALKVIRKGIDSDSVRARFEAERQTLALTDHPNIAKLFDAGTTESGRPYFVMELVPGLPITQYCDQKHLTIQERVELYITTCRAVHHTHQKGIIHRDLKPSNILVTEVDQKPSPKVIDFGVSRMTTPGESNSQDSGMFATPQYMSPEQASTDQGEVDIRSDVYALGAMLYEILSGVTAFDWTNGPVQTIQGLRRVFDAGPPAPPSRRFASLTDTIELKQITDDRRTGIKRLQRSLQKDLDWIIQKAIARDRTDRYDSVAAFADDLQRHLDHRPVRASPGGTLYFFSRFYRRNRAVVILLTAIAVSLLTSLFVVSSLLIRTRVAGEQAGHDRDRAVEAELVTAISESELKADLRSLYIQQARADMMERSQGRRMKAFKAIRAAAKINPNPPMELRNQSIACMSIPDLELIDTLKVSDAIGAPVFNRTRDRYAYAAADGSVHVAQMPDRAEISHFSVPAKSAVAIYAFSPNSRYVEFAWDHTSFQESKRDPRVDRSQVWDLETNRPIACNPNWAPGDFNFRSDRWAGVNNSSNAVEIYDLPSGQLVKTIPTVTKIHRLLYSPDGERIAIACNDDQTIRVLDVNSGLQVATIPTGGQWIWNFAWDPSGKYVAVTGQNQTNQILSFDVQTGAIQTTMRGALGTSLDVSYSDDGRFLLTGGWDGRVRLWDARYGDEFLNIDRLGNGLTFIGNRRFVMPAAAGTQTWDIISGQECRTYIGELAEDNCENGVISPDGKLLAAAMSVGIRVWNVASGKSYAFVAAAGVRSLAFSPDSATLYASVPDGVLNWNLAAIADRDDLPGELVSSEKTTAMALSRDGRAMVYGNADGDLFVSDPATDKPQPLIGPKSRQRRFVAISPDGKWAAVSGRYDNGFLIWNLTDRKLAATLPRDGPGDLGPVAFSADSQTLLIDNGWSDRWFHVGDWNLLRTLERITNSGKIGSPGQVALSPDGKFAALTGGRGEAILVDEATGETLAAFETPATPQTVSTLGFSPDSTFLIITGGGKVTLWNIPLVRHELAEMNLDWK